MEYQTESYLDESDREWLRDLAGLCSSHSHFILAEFKDPHDSFTLAYYAAGVLVWRDQEFSPIPQFIEECEAHDWNATIYEAWVWQTENRLYEMQGTLGPTASRAFELVASNRGYGKPNTRLKDPALDHARACLEGTLTPDLEEQFDSEFLDAAFDSN